MSSFFYIGLWALLSFAPFFRGKHTNRYYVSISVPRMAVVWHPHPRLRFTSRFTRLGLLRVCAFGTRGQYG